MLVLRALLGGVLGGVVPILYSIFSDLYPSSKRSMVSAVVATASGGGILLGQVVSGVIGSYLSWRVPYLAIGALGLAAVALVWIRGEEPERGACP